MENNKIIYSLCIEDIQNVAEENLERKLSNQELKMVIDKLGDFIDWRGAIGNTINYCLADKLTETPQNNP